MPTTHKTAPNKPRPRPRPKAAIPRVRLPGPRLTIASLFHEHPQTRAFCTLAGANTCISSTLPAHVFEIQLELQPMARATSSAAARMHHGPSGAQLDNLLPGTRADAVAHRLQCLELVEHAGGTSLAGAAADRTADGTGWGDAGASAEQRRCPHRRFERHRRSAMAVR